jgi:hypothetical protein
VLLVLAAVLADSNGSRSLARDLLLGAVALGAVAALASFGDFLDARGDRIGGLQALLWAVVVALLVLSSAVRSDAVHGVPPLARSSLVACLAVLALKGALTAVPYLRRLAPLRPAKP